MKGIQSLLQKKNPLKSLNFLENINPSNLRYLDISNTKITEINFGIKKYFKYLEKFDLSNSLIKSIEVLLEINFNN